MIRTTKDYSIAQIFSTDKRRFYDIPKYQREYTWGRKEISMLFNDILENDNGYFLGSIICVDQSIGGMQTDVHLQLIDGQQRLTSLSLLLLAIYSKLKTLKNDFLENQEDKFRKLKEELVLYDEEISHYVPRLTLQIQAKNKVSYNYLLKENDLLDTDQERNKKGKIYNAFKIFLELIEEYIEEKKKIDINLQIHVELFKLLDKINSAVIVAIEVENNKDAYMLFESLNNRGIPLSAIDLIKNILLYNSEKDIEKEPNATEESYNKWKNILNSLGEEYSVRERFFRQYYNTYREELNAPYQVPDVKYYFGYLATKSTILDIYEKLINKIGYKTFLDNMEKEAKLYSVIIGNASDEDKIDKLEIPLLNLSRIQGAPSYILLLYLFSKRNTLQITIEDIKDVVDYLIKFFVRRNITDFPNTRNLTQIFMDTISSVFNKQSTGVINEIKNILRKKSSTDELFKEKLNGPLYEINPEATRFMLCYYEEKYNTTREHYTDLWKRDDKSKYIWTIEHIFPEGKNIPQYWIDMIADGNKELANKYLDEYVHTIGNLTITGYNQSLRNFDFDKKKNRTDKDGRYIGYKNGLKLNEDVVNENAWTIDKIKNRTNKLVEIFEKDFKL